MKSHKALPKRIVVRSQGYAGPPRNAQKMATVAIPTSQTSQMYDPNCGLIQRGKLVDADASNT